MGEYPEASIRSSDGGGRFGRTPTGGASGASTASRLAYQSLRGLIRSLAGASGASRSMSKVNLTSFDVNGLPSCHFTSLRRKNTRFRKLSCQDHFSARSGTIVSMLSVGLVGSKNTRLLKHGKDGKLVEYVAASCTAKPCGRSSRSMTLIVPPCFGVCAEVAEATMTVERSARPSILPTRREHIMDPSPRARPERRPRERMVGGDQRLG